MRDLVDLFHEAYSGETRRRSRFGMDRTDEGRGAAGMSGDDYDPRNNPYADGRDLDDVTWDDEDIPTESPDEEREITRRQKAGLDAALADARADEMEDGEDEDEAEDEDEDEAIDFGKAGVRDS